VIKDQLYGYYSRLKAKLEPHWEAIDKWGFDAACIATPIVLFLLFFNPYVLDPTRIGWLLVNDWGQHVLGWNAFRHVPWSWAFYYEDLLASPTGLSIIYTDSNPPWTFWSNLLARSCRKIFNISGRGFFCVSPYRSMSPSGLSAPLRRENGPRLAGQLF
jgi:hypothetical protein